MKVQLTSGEIKIISALCNLGGLKLILKTSNNKLEFYNSDAAGTIFGKYVSKTEQELDKKIYLIPSPKLFEVNLKRFKVDGVVEIDVQDMFIEFTSEKMKSKIMLAPEFLLKEQEKQMMEYLDNFSEDKNPSFLFMVDTLEPIITEASLRRRDEVLVDPENQEIKIMSSSGNIKDVLFSMKIECSGSVPEFVIPINFMKKLYSQKTEVLFRLFDFNDKSLLIASFGENLNYMTVV